MYIHITAVCLYCGRVGAGLSVVWELMYIHHYLTELVAFSAEINIISHTIVILTYL